MRLFDFLLQTIENKVMIPNVSIYVIICLVVLVVTFLILCYTK